MYIKDLQMVVQVVQMVQVVQVVKEVKEIQVVQVVQVVKEVQVVVKRPGFKHLGVVVHIRHVSWKVVQDVFAKLEANSTKKLS